MKLFKKEVDKDKVLYGGLIITFIILYGATAFVSWYHAITFFNIANAVWLSVLLSFVAEIGQASVLFSILLTENKHKFLPWVVMIILTTLQVIGNVVSSYDWIIKHGGAGVESFQKSILFFMTAADPEIFKVVIAWISGALLPIIALSMTALVAQNMELRAEQAKTVLDGVDDSPPKAQEPVPTIDAQDIISEVSKVRPTKEELETLEMLLNSKKPIEKPPVEDILGRTEEEINHNNEILKKEQQKFIDELSRKNESEIKEPNDFHFKSPGVFTTEKLINHEPSVEEIIAGLTPEAKQYMKSALEEDVPPTDQLSNEEVIPHYSDEELTEMFMDEYEKKGKYFPEDDLDEEVEHVSFPLDPESQVDLLRKLAMNHQNGLVEGISVEPQPSPSPELISPPEPTPSIKVDETKPEPLSPEQLERIRQIARDNLKKK
jgi:hypothetical protein